MVDGIDIGELTECILEEPYFEDGGPIPFSYDPGSDDFLVVVGQNAGGKSFFRRLFVEYVDRGTGVEEVMHLSMQDRAGDNFKSGVMKSMVYGSEREQSTGDISRMVVQNGFKNSENRPRRHFMLWDEPALGSTPEAALAIAGAICGYVHDLPEMSEGVVLMSNQQRVLRVVEDRTDPHYLCLGDQQEPTLGAWVERDIEPEDLDALKERGLRRRRAIQAVINEGSEG